MTDGPKTEETLAVRMVGTTVNPSVFEQTANEQTTRFGVTALLVVALKLVLTGAGKKEQSNESRWS